MNFVVGLCGTHGTGKSTILKDSRTLGYAVAEVQLSRTAQKALGWDSLKRVEESVNNVWALQNAILDALLIRDEEINKTGTLTIVERTPADLMAYTRVWCKRLNIDENDAQVIHYLNRCIFACEAYAQFIYVPTSDAIPFVADPHRADLESRTFVAEAIRDFLEYSEFHYAEIVPTDRKYRALAVQKILQLTLGAK